jgi:hypothetical protein
MGASGDGPSAQPNAIRQTTAVETEKALEECMALTIDRSGLAGTTLGTSHFVTRDASAGAPAECHHGAAFRAVFLLAGRTTGLFYFYPLALNAQRHIRKQLDAFRRNGHAA